MDFMGQLGGATILDLEMHLMAHKFALLRDMCQQDQPWITMMQYFVDHEELVLRKQRFKHHGGHYSMDTLFLYIYQHFVCRQRLVSHGKMHYLFLSGQHKVIENFAICYKMNCSFLLEYHREKL